MAPQPPAELAVVLRRAAARLVPDLEETIAIVMKRALEICREVIGSETVLPGWEPFADATVDDPRRFGTFERTAEMEASLYIIHRGLVAELASSSRYMRYHEEGTGHEPPRPMLEYAIRRALREVGVGRLRFTLERVIR